MYIILIYILNNYIMNIFMWHIRTYRNLTNSMSTLSFELLLHEKLKDSTH